MSELLLISVLLLGVGAGLRAFTPLAILCWAAHWNWIPLQGTRLAFFSSTAIAILVSVIALGELVNDKLPWVGKRTAPPAFAARVLLGTLCGAAVFLAMQKQWIMGAGIGAIGAVIGTLGGFHLRRLIGVKTGLPDLVVALFEDLIAVAGSLFIISHLS